MGERPWRQASDRGKALAGRCTLNRLELTAAEVDEQERYKKIAMDPNRIDGWMVDAFVESHESAPEEIVLDLVCDATTRSMASRRGRFFHGYYRHYCYRPAVHLLGGASAVRPVAVFQYRWGRVDRWRNWNGSSAGFGRAGRRSRSSSGPTRAFAGMTCSAGVKTITWNVMGLANNDRLKSESAEAMTQAEAEFNATGTPARVFKDFRYRTRHSWTSERRVVGKAEFLEKGANPRFVVTSLSPERLGARALYEDFYCARGDMENRIKEQQLDLFADRTSAATMRANQLRLYLS